MEDFSNKIKDSVWWWLGKKRPFIINNEYRLELLFIDKVNNSAKIKITNIKTGQVSDLEISEESSFEASYGQE